MGKDNGGPAFPYDNKSDGDESGFVRTPSSSGMSLRDYLAAKAMQGMLASEALLKSSFQLNGQTSMGLLVRAAYETADLMLDEKKKEEWA